ncbi:hypothetical protein STEG23_002916 [Scotinomys teguina]
MARKYFYFDYDFYNLSFYEEEVKTEIEKSVICTANSGSFHDEVMEALNKLNFESHQSSADNYSQDPEQEEMEGARTLVDEQPSFRIRQKAYRFTPGQLWELRAVFEETHYPDAVRRKELAELMNVDEQKVKDWFNNKRAKFRRSQRKMANKNLSPIKEDLDMKTVVEFKKVIIFQEQVGDGLVCCHQDFDIYAISIFPHLY